MNTTFYGIGWGDSSKIDVDFIKVFDVRGLLFDLTSRRGNFCEFSFLCTPSFSFASSELKNVFRVEESPLWCASVVLFLVLTLPTYFSNVPAIGHRFARSVGILSGVTMTCFGSKNVTSVLALCFSAYKTPTCVP